MEAVLVPPSASKTSQSTVNEYPFIIPKLQTALKDLPINLEISLDLPDSNDFLENMVKNLFDLKPSQIISKLKLKNPIYGRFASYGHFGRQKNCSWEKTDLVNKIKEFVNNND